MNPTATAQVSATRKEEGVIPEEMRTKCEVWTRVMGYHRPTSQFNIGKKQEQAERVHFAEGRLDDEDDEGCAGGCDSCGGCS